MGESTQPVGEALAHLIWDSAATSAGVSLMAAAPVFSSTCATEPVPGIGSIAGDRASSQASTI